MQYRMVFLEWHAFQTLWETKIESRQHFWYFGYILHTRILGTVLKPAIYTIFFVRLEKLCRIREIISNKKIYAILYRETSSKPIPRL